MPAGGQQPQSAAYRTLLHDALLTVRESRDDLSRSRKAGASGGYVPPHLRDRGGGAHQVPAPALSDEAVEIVLSTPRVISLPKLEVPLDASGITLLHPLLDALRSRGYSAKAAQYVLHYGVSALGEDGDGQPALAALLEDMESQGDYDGIFRLCAKAGKVLDGPEQSASQRHTAWLTSGLSERRWIADAENFEPLLSVVNSLLALKPPGLFESVELVLSTLSPKAAQVALRMEHQVSTLLSRLATAEPSAALRLLRKWTVPAKSQQVVVKGAVMLGTRTTPTTMLAKHGWTIADLGDTTAASILGRLLGVTDLAAARDGGTSPPVSIQFATGAVKDICAFSLRAEFQHVLQSLLDAGVWDAAVSWARGDGAEQEAWQSKVLRHMALTQGGPLPLPLSPSGKTLQKRLLESNDVAIPSSQEWLRDLRRLGYVGGGLAALTAIVFNPRKKATTPKPVHAWTIFEWDGTGGKEGEADPFSQGRGGSRGRSRSSRGRGRGRGRGSGRGPCRYGVACKRQNCFFTHPNRARQGDQTEAAHASGGSWRKGMGDAPNDGTEPQAVSDVDCSAGIRVGAPWLRLSDLRCTDHMVSTAADVTAASASLLPILARATRESSGGPAMIGLDTESIPVTVPRRREQSLNFRQAIPQPVALLQVASEQHAFLFDLPALSTDPQACTAADKLLVRLFGEEGLLKLGQGFDDDLKLLRKAHPKFSAWSRMRNLLDISAVYHLVPRANGVEPQSQSEPPVACKDYIAQPQAPKTLQPVSLAKLVAYTTARPMDKRYQISDWGQRPLSPAQREYAALDARVLLTVVSVLGARIGGRAADCSTERDIRAVETVRVSSAYLPAGRDLRSRPAASVD